MEKRRLSIIAGGGYLPKLIANELKNTHEIFVIALDAECDPDTVSDIPHEWVNIAAAGKIMKILERENISEVVLAGSVKRPPLTSLRPDFEGMKLLGKIMLLHNQGDDAILSAIIKHLEESGLRVVGVQELLKNLLVEEGPLGKIRPAKRDLEDVEIGRRLLLAIGSIDVGQAVIIQAGRVIGIEAVEGTDKLIERCAPYIKEDKGGVLLKMRKSGQDMRADLPAIGLRTVENIANAGLFGIALEARSALVIEKEKVIEAANRHGIFILGIK